MDESSKIIWNKIDNVIRAQYGKFFDKFTNEEGEFKCTMFEIKDVFSDAFGENQQSEKEQIVNKVIEALFREVFVDKVPVDKAKENAVNRLKEGGLK